MQCIATKIGAPQPPLPQDVPTGVGRAHSSWPRPHCRRLFQRQHIIKNSILQHAARVCSRELPAFSVPALLVQRSAMEVWVQSRPCQEQGVHKQKRHVG